MTPEDRARLGALLSEQRLVALGVVVDGEPVVGLLPYALAEDFAALYVQASRLARHSQGLSTGNKWSGVVHEPDGGERDALQVPRLVLEGTVERLVADTAAHQEASAAFLGRFPSAEMTLQLGDFALYRLEIEGGRLILGFGRALNLSRSHFADLAKS